jgi:hypothetical protein
MLATAQSIQIIRRSNGREVQLTPEVTRALHPRP